MVLKCAESLYYLTLLFNYYNLLDYLTLTTVVNFNI